MPWPTGNRRSRLSKGLKRVAPRQPDVSGHIESRSDLKDQSSTRPPIWCGHPLKEGSRHDQTDHPHWPAELDHGPAPRSQRPPQDGADTAVPWSRRAADHQLRAGSAESNTVQSAGLTSRGVGAGTTVVHVPARPQIRQPTLSVLVAPTPRLCRRMRVFDPMKDLINDHRTDP